MIYGSFRFLFLGLIFAARFFQFFSFLWFATRRLLHVVAHDVCVSVIIIAYMRLLKLVVDGSQAS
jgi:hypothetical protein